MDNKIHKYELYTADTTNICVKSRVMWMKMSWCQKM
jgi:hypothetical protein